MRPRTSPEPTTTLLCIICILVTLAHTTTRDTDPGLWAHIGHFTDVTSMQIWSGRYFPLFTDMFLHSDFTSGLGITHLIFDVFWLYQLGCMLERSIGPVWYILFIVASAMVGSCSELVWSGGTDIGIGASGVVYALFGFMWTGRFRFPEWQNIVNPYNMRMMIAWGVYCIFTTYLHLMSIGNGAHFGGLAFGYCVGMLCFAQRPVDGTPERLRAIVRRLAWAIPLAGVLAICIMGVTYIPWSESWLWWRADKAFDQRDYRSAVTYYERAARLSGNPADLWFNVALSWHHRALDDSTKGDLKAATTDLQNESEAAGKSGGTYKLDN